MIVLIKALLIPILYNVVACRLATAAALPLDTTTSTTIPDLIKRYNLTMYESTLMNKTLLPFLANCERTAAADGPNINTKILCDAYFEMVIEANDMKLQDFRSADNVQQYLRLYDAVALSSMFCEKFHNEVPNRQPKFMPHRETNTFHEIIAVKQTCQLLCMELSANLVTVIVKPICRLISAGFIQIVFNENPEHLQPSPPEMAPIVVDDGPRIAKPKVAQAIPNQSGPLMPDPIHLQPQPTTTTTPKPILGELETTIKEVQPPAFVMEKTEAAVPPSPAQADNYEPQTAVDQPQKQKTVANVPFVPLQVDNVPPVVDGKPVAVQQPIAAAQQPPNKNVAIQQPKASWENRVPASAIVIENAAANTVVKPTENGLPPIIAPIVTGGGGELNLDTNGGNVETNDLDTESEDMDVDVEQKDGKETVGDATDQETNDYNNYDETLKPKKASGSVDISVGTNVASARSDPFLEGTDSNFFSYFMAMMFVCIVLYVAYHNKTKVIALVLEGRRSSSDGRGGGIGRRKHTAAYRKLDTNLEEAIKSNNSGRTAQIIY